MREELQEKLFSAYPGLFKQKDLPMSKTCMCWGIDCGDGWYELLDNACMKLKDFEELEFKQVKEKFGSLRIYIKCRYKDYEEAQQIIDDAEAMSEKTCEECGDPGELRNVDGWTCTLCLECANGRVFQDV